MEENGIKIHVEIKALEGKTDSLSQNSEEGRVKKEKKSEIVKRKFKETISSEWEFYRVCFRIKKWEKQDFPGGAVADSVLSMKAVPGQGTRSHLLQLTAGRVK